MKKTTLDEQGRTRCCGSDPTFYGSTLSCRNRGCGRPVDWDSYLAYLVASRQPEAAPVKRETSSTKTRKPTVVVDAFVRDHGRRPSGRGGWAFQASRTPWAYSRDLFGEIFWANGTFTEARQAAQAHFAGQADVVAVAALP